MTDDKLNTSLAAITMKWSPITNNTLVTQLSDKHFHHYTDLLFTKKYLLHALRAYY